MSDSAVADPRVVRVLGIAGSLRAGSYNRMLLHAAVELAPSDMHLRLFERVGDLPLYNADIDLPGDAESEPVAVLRQSIRAADALLFVTPEYNYGVPGVLKNLIDWASRPPATSSLKGKPAAIMGAATGLVGTARAQLQLRQAFVFTQTHVTTAPEVLVSKAQEKFDANGRLTDEPTREFVRKHLESLVVFARRFRGG